MSVPVRVLTPVATVLRLRIFWGDDCPCSFGSGFTGCHNAYSAPVARVETPHVTGFTQQHPPPEEWPAQAWPTTCASCGAGVPWSGVLEHQRQTIAHTLYRAQDGAEVIGDSQQIGDLWPAPCWRERQGIPCYWANCSGTHWIVRCPGGMSWDINSRASNCDKKDERTHRCWVAHGDPPLHVDKAGHTCGAGAGSIQTDNWHGFLHHGRLA